TIHSNSGTGILILGGSSTGNAVLGNSIYNNAGLGIDLNNSGVTPNDLGDADSGSNNQQNFPVLTSASSTTTSTTITGTLNSTANSIFRVEFFANVTADPTGFGEGQTYLGFTNVTTDGSGNASFSVTLPQATPAGRTVTATATSTSSLPGPQDWWAAEGNANDSTGFRHGALQNGVTFAPGAVGQTFNLDGIDDHIDLGSIGPQTDGSPFSISAWINLDSAEVAAGSYGVIFSNGTTAAGANNNPFNSYFRVNGEGAAASLTFGLGYTQLYDARKTTSAIIPAATWTHVVATYDGSRTRNGLKLYVNGVQVATTDGGGGFGSAMYEWSDWHIGVTKARDGSFTNPLKGQIDEVGFYTRPITATEVSAIYRDPANAPAYRLLIPGDTSEFSGNRVVTAANQPP